MSEQLNIETFAEAKARNRERIKIFLNSNDGVLVNIAKKLSVCCKNNRCNQLSCPICLRIFRKKYIKEQLPQWEKLFDICPIYFVTLVCRVPVDVKVDSLNGFRDWITNALKQYHFDTTPLVGGIDYSYNYKNGESYICQHLHILVATYDVEAFKQCLKKYFFSDENVVLPVYPKLVKDKAGLYKTLNYTIPAFFEKHCQYEVGANRKTRKLPISSKQVCEMYRFLSSNIPSDLAIIQDITTKKEAQTNL